MDFIKFRLIAGLIDLEIIKNLRVEEEYEGEEGQVFCFQVFDLWFWSFGIGMLVLLCCWQAVCLRSFPSSSKSLVRLYICGLVVITQHIVCCLVFFMLEVCFNHPLLAFTLINIINIFLVKIYYFNKSFYINYLIIAFNFFIVFIS